MIIFRGLRHCYKPEEMRETSIECLQCLHLPINNLFQGLRTPSRVSSGTLSLKETSSDGACVAILSMLQIITVHAGDLARFLNICHR